MRFVCFNANGIRARMHQLEAICAAHDPDVLAIQETKVADDAFPLQAIRDLGFDHTAYFGQKGHYGVALLSRLAPQNVQLGLPWGGADQQRRFVSARYPCGDGHVRIINGYFPQGESRDHAVKFAGKRQFYADMQRYLREYCSADEHLLLAGDMNVAPEDADIGISDHNRKRWVRSGKCSFLPEEREWLSGLMAWGLYDSYSAWIADRPRLQSWFDYRSRGFEQDPKRGLRIDLILTSRSVTDAITDCGIDHTIRAQERPSDHCPIWCHFDL
ncbi:MAG: exodeoxyribonuclease III [Pseudomonadales bacterium]